MFTTDQCESSFVLCFRLNHSWTAHILNCRKYWEKFALWSFIHRHFFTEPTSLNIFCSYSKYQQSVNDLIWSIKRSYTPSHYLLVVTKYANICQTQCLIVRAKWNCAHRLACTQKQRLKTKCLRHCQKIMRRCIVSHWYEVSANSD